MRTSIIIAAHNEGSLLTRTVSSVLKTIEALEAEVVVADDASADGSIGLLRDEFPEVRVESSVKREGVSRTKDRGARIARGQVLVFLDGHCNPEHGALARLVEDVELSEGQAIITPTICPLDVANWQNCVEQSGHGYFVCLQTLVTGWRPLDQLQPRRLQGSQPTGTNRLFYESPTFQGCAVAMGRDLYQRLGGFDTDMLFWGSEDVDLGLKSWLLGHPVLHDPNATIGHRFQQSFDNYDVPPPHILANQLRMARKSFNDEVWTAWLPRLQRQRTESVWQAGWDAFNELRASVESERRYLMEHRVRDEFWYVDRFTPQPSVAAGSRATLLTATDDDPPHPFPTIDPDDPSPSPGTPSPEPSSPPTSPSPPSPAPPSPAPPSPAPPSPAPPASPSPATGL